MPKPSAKWKKLGEKQGDLQNFVDGKINPLKVFEANFITPKTDFLVCIVQNLALMMIFC